MEADDPVWAGLLPCAPRASARRWHALAGVLLLVLLLRLGWPGSVPALLLSGCLWWVAQRQAGAQAAAWALLLLAGVPRLLHAERQVWAAAGLFAAVYTALGVAHALQGPRRKWLPRIVLMTAVTAGLALASPLACAFGLPLALVAAWYVARNKRRVLLPLAGFWAVLAAVLARVSGDSATPVGASGGGGYGGLLFLLVCALVLWTARRRSRWFGNGLPLGAAVFFFPAHELEPGALVWCLPFLLLMLAGIAADMLEGEHKRAWSVGFWTYAGIQFISSFV